jgi:hypothetical protein
LNRSTLIDDTLGHVDVDVSDCLNCIGQEGAPKTLKTLDVFTTSPRSLVTSHRFRKDDESRGPASFLLSAFIWFELKDDDNAHLQGGGGNGMDDPLDAQSLDGGAEYRQHHHLMVSEPIRHRDSNADLHLVMAKFILPAPNIGITLLDFLVQIKALPGQGSRMLALAAATSSVANAVCFETDDITLDDGPQKVALAILMISLQKGWFSSYLRLLRERSYMIRQFYEEASVFRKPVQGDFEGASSDLEQFVAELQLLEAMFLREMAATAAITEAGQRGGEVQYDDEFIVDTTVAPPSSSRGGGLVAAAATVVLPHYSKNRIPRHGSNGGRNNKMDVPGDDTGHNYDDGQLMGICGSPENNSVIVMNDDKDGSGMLGPLSRFGSSILRVVHEDDGSKAKAARSKAKDKDKAKDKEDNAIHFGGPEASFVGEGNFIGEAITNVATSIVDSTSNVASGVGEGLDSIGTFAKNAASSVVPNSDSMSFAKFNSMSSIPFFGKTSSYIRSI